jgi:hypothetical protein
MIREYWNNPLSVTTLRSTFRFMWRLAKALQWLLPAGAGILLRRNLGPRQLPAMFLGLLTFIVPAMLDPTGISAILFFLLVARALSHAANTVFARPADGPPRHSHYEGDSLRFWRNAGVSQERAQRHFEPALCLLAAVIFAPFLPVLSLWLGGAGIALFTKDLTTRSRMRRRVQDAVDSRIESQQTSAAVDAHLRPHAQAAERFHRARPARTTIPSPRRRR